MTDRADEIARELVEGVENNDIRAAQIRAYGDEKLEQAAKHFDPCMCKVGPSNMEMDSDWICDACSIRALKEKTDD